MSSIPALVPLRPHLHEIRDEDAPPYDGQYVQRGRHVTILDDDVVDTILGTLGTTAFAIYVYLDRRCNAEGVCDPKVETIARDCRTSESTVHRQLALLEEHKWIKREEQFNRYGFQSNNRFVLPSHHRKQRTDRGVIETVIEGVIETVNMTPPKVVVSSTEVVTSNTPPTPSRGVERRSQKPNLDGFAEWYAAYPRHIARATAEKAWEKLSGEERAAALEAIRRQVTWPVFANAPTDKIPYPATWLNARRWEDEPDKERQTEKDVSKLPYNSAERMRAEGRFAF